MSTVSTWHGYGVDPNPPRSTPWNGYGPVTEPIKDEEVEGVATPNE